MLSPTPGGRVRRRAFPRAPPNVAGLVEQLPTAPAATPARPGVRLPAPLRVEHSARPRPIGAHQSGVWSIRRELRPGPHGPRRAARTARRPPPPRPRRARCEPRQRANQPASTDPHPRDRFPSAPVPRAIPRSAPIRVVFHCTGASSESAAEPPGTVGGAARTKRALEPDQLAAVISSAASMANAASLPPLARPRPLFYVRSRGQARRRCRSRHGDLNPSARIGPPRRGDGEASAIRLRAARRVARRAAARLHTGRSIRSTRLSVTPSSASLRSARFLARRP